MMNGKRIQRFLIVLAWIQFLSSCAGEVVQKEEETLFFHATWAESQETRTELQSDGTNVWWSVGEQINVFFGGFSSGRFASTNDHPQPLVQFQGNLSILTGNMELPNPPLAYWAVYPYDAANTCDGVSVTLSLPVLQSGKENTFDNHLFPAIATSQNFALAFYNVCGGARFNVQTEGITSITFTAIGGESLSGQVRVAFADDGKPVVKQIIDGNDRVTVTAPEGFVPGENYFAVFLPGVLSEGLSVSFTKGKNSASRSIEKEITVHRSRFGLLDNLDEDVSFPGTPPAPGPDPEDLIHFADPRIKEILVSAFDSDGDQELSYTEAAAVTSLGSIFDEDTDFVSFDEFQFFTGITAIAPAQFLSWDRMTSICLPDSITEIGANAFSGCHSLTSIVLPAGIQSLGERILYNCRSLNKLTIGKCFSSLAYLGIEADTCVLSELYLSEGLSSINPYSFQNYKSLVSIHLPESLTEIPDAAFDGCIGLEMIDLSSQLTKIGRRCFQGCTALESITLPASLASLGDSAFKDCDHLKSITLPNGIQTIAGKTFQGCRNLASVNLPDGLVFLEARAFEGCASLTSIDLPEKTRALRENLFNGCVSLTSISIPESCTIVGDSAFVDCQSLRYVYLPNSMISIGTSAFSGCSSLSVIVLPSDLGSLGDSVFKGCSSLTSIILPNSISSIGDALFEDCSSLAFVGLPENCTSIGKNAFSDCSRLESISLPNTLTSIGRSAFSNSGLKAISVPKGVTDIAQGTFYHCEQLASISLKEGINSISGSAFAGCLSLSEISIPKSVERIRGAAFQNCQSLTTVILKSLIPPTLDDLPAGSTFSGDDLCLFYVPDDAVDAYKAQSTWAVYADRIFPVSTLN